MRESLSETRVLLEHWHAGDRSALERLLERDLPWIREQVKRRLGPALRAKDETQDFVHEAVVEALEYSPPFLIDDRDRFRGLLVRIVENVLRDRDDWYRARRRDMARERPLPSASVLQLEVEGSSPSQAADRSEWEDWLRLGLEFLDAEDRTVILRRQWDGQDYESLGRELGVSADAARMRFNRALSRLAQVVERLKRGDLEP